MAKLGKHENAEAFITMHMTLRIVHFRDGGQGTCTKSAADRPHLGAHVLVFSPSVKLS